jgi:hypothetical protein
VRAEEAAVAAAVQVSLSLYLTTSRKEKKNYSLAKCHETLKNHLLWVTAALLPPVCLSQCGWYESAAQTNERKSLRLAAQRKRKRKKSVRFFFRARRYVLSLIQLDGLVYHPRIRTHSDAHSRLCRTDGSGGVI